ncbi:uncharacterized protein LOC117123333 [Anneissia japonica]|uniref:uncharacterized protein LOC117123333 n=1 Tax=Anneissia japonica TaxID=1529436 RepID=UPI001425B010|nr:uncharacterized protein LOC117123333 [Anneissia japonica]
MYLLFEMTINYASDTSTMDTDCEVNMVCIICRGSQGDSLKMFVERTWCSFKRAAELRLALKSDRYRDITTEVNLQQHSDNARYHSKCYRKYTAVIRPPTGSPSKKPKTRRRSLMPPSDEKGLLKGSCIFCILRRKTINHKEEPLSDCLTKDGCDAIFKAAPKSSNERVKALVQSGVDLIAKEAQYITNRAAESFLVKLMIQKPIQKLKQFQIGNCIPLLLEQYQP